MIPAWLLRLLPQIGIMAALIGAVWWLDHRGYSRAMADRDARDGKMLAQIQGELRESEHRLARDVQALGGDYELQRAALSHIGESVHPIIIKEAADDPRLSDPAAGLTPGLLDAINRAARLAPVPPPLPAALSAPCPSLPPVTGRAIIDLARADIEAALAHAGCAARHAGAVNAYGVAREALIEWNGRQESDGPARQSPSGRR